MKLAFSTTCCPHWDAKAIASGIKELGYHGVEIAACAEGTQLSEELSAQSVTIACVGCTGDRVQQAIKTAQAVGCDRVKVTGLAHTELTKLARWLQPLGDEAIGRGVTLVIENQPPFAIAHAMWLLLEAINHPAIAAAWDVCTAAVAGESPWVSVPNLNSRIAYAMVQDARLSDAAAASCAIGQGDVPLDPFVKRLMGIGYEGWVSVQTLGGDEDSPSTSLADALHKLQSWSKPPATKRPPHRAAPIRR